MSNGNHIRLLITAGDGPAECGQAIAGILHRMGEEASLYGISLSQHSQGGRHGPRSAILLVHGPCRQSFANRWIGTIQWTMQSQLRPAHKRRNWFVGIFVLEENCAAPCSIRQTDVHFSTLRAGGPGGQHQNTTDSAVRATHTPSGLTVVVREARSQHRNRALALQRLRELADAQATTEAETQRQRQNLLHHSLERGNPVRRFTGAKFRKVT